MYYNCHIHTFKDTDVPRKFLPLGLVRILSTITGFNVIARILNYINPFSDNDALDLYVKFVKTSRLGSQKKIFEEVKRFYPDYTKFVILPMDMAYMGAGEVPRKYEEQIRELAQLNIDYPQVIPFFHADPRREGLLDMFKNSVETLGIKGLKIYPPLGYFPYDPALYPVYQYCIDKNLPVMSHCSPYNPVHFKGKKMELLQLLSKSLTPIDTEKKNIKELCSYFTHPKNWEKVMTDFPNLRVCLGHFGSTDYWTDYMENPGNPKNWFDIIRKMMPRYPNLYSDISFTLYNKDYLPLLKVLLTDPVINQRVLFGSDYYMVETITNERAFGLRLRAFIGEDYFTSIAVTNPERYLGVP
jgi:predicted TIM-barrel fold metal-dependent hydrolase